MEPGFAVAQADVTDRLTGDAPAMRALRAQIRHLAAFDRIGSDFVPTLLLQGETGTGKGLLARVVHDSGPRARGRFITVNCAALPENLLEAEVFGFEAGAFTDARRAKAGLLEEASQGTLFLDEIDTLPLPLQAKLLAVLEEKRARRLGAVAERAIDVKLIAATQTDLSAAVSAGRFRLDLFHRLAMVILNVPPLRERGQDILRLARQFLLQAAAGHGLVPKTLSRAAEMWLMGQEWPGNVRELRHLMERITLLSSEAVVEASTMQQWCLAQPAVAPPPAAPPTEHGPVMDEATRIRQALTQTGGNVARAARLLGLSRKALRYRMQRYAIGRPDLQPAAEEHVGVVRVVQAPSIETAAVPGWQLKPVTVLAVEMTFSSAPVAGLLRDDPWTVLAGWEKAIGAEVQKFGGVLLQRSPPALIAVFGVPHALEQMPQRTVQAALAIQRRVAAARSVAAANSPDLRLAVHLGAVLVGAGSSDPTQRLMGVGETLALPLRLLGHAAAGEIVVSAEVGRLVGGWFALHARELAPEVNSHDRGLAYTVAGIKAAPALLAIQGERPLSPFVGRSREIAALHNLLAQVERSRGQVVGLLGEPGVGKSRLVYELCQSLEHRRVLYMEGHCLAYGGAMPYLPVLELLRACFRIATVDSAGAIAEKVRDGLHAVGMVPEAWTPYLLELLGISQESEWSARLSPEAIRARTFEIIRQIFLRTSQDKPLILVVEDLHWMDTISEELFASLVDHLAGARVLLLVTYRPGYRPAWLDKSYATQMTLQPLSAVESLSLMQPMISELHLSETQVHDILAHAEGNPFFLEELARAVAEQTDLPSRRAVPATVQAVLMARIDRLPEAPKRILQTASVFGREVPIKLLEAIREETELPDQHLEELQRLEFLFPRIGADEPVYVFKHALTQETAYESMLPERRRALHRRIVEVVETLTRERVTAQIEWLAHHALHGEVWDKALAYCRQAGERALARSANQEAALYFEQALDALEHMPAQNDTSAQAIDLWLDLHAALLPSGNSERILETLRTAEALAEAQHNAGRVGQVCISLSQYFFLRGEYGQSMVPAERALALGNASGDVVIEALANHRLGLAHWAQGNYRSATHCLLQTVRSLDGDRRRERFGLVFLPAAFSRALLACCHAELGSFAEGRALADEGLKIAEEVDHPASVMTACWGRGMLALRQGDLSAAVSYLERALGICQEVNLPVWFPRMATALGSAYIASGRAMEAVPLLTQAMEQTAAGKTAAFPALCSLPLGEAHLLTNDLEKAQVFAERSLAHARSHRERGNEGYALTLLGDIAVRRKSPAIESAEVHYRQALAVAEELAMRPLEAHCHADLGVFYFQTGRPDAARAKLTAAIELYGAMEMNLWIPQARAAVQSL